MNRPSVRYIPDEGQRKAPHMRWYVAHTGPDGTPYAPEACLQYATREEAEGDLRRAHHASIPDARKGALYDAGAYSCPAPPVPTSGWDRAAWIRYVDANGAWKDGAR